MRGFAARGICTGLEKQHRIEKARHLVQEWKEQVHQKLAAEKKQLRIQRVIAGEIEPDGAETVLFHISSGGDKHRATLLIPQLRKNVSIIEEYISENQYVYLLEMLGIRKFETDGLVMKADLHDVSQMRNMVDAFHKDMLDLYADDPDGQLLMYAMAEVAPMF